MNYYDQVFDGNLKQYLKKLPHPIMDKCFNGVPYTPIKYGDAMTICKNSTLFNEPNPAASADERYALGMGGVYKLERPGTSQQPLYFAFPYGQGIFFDGGPDLRLYYGLIEDSVVFNCTSGARKVIQNYQTYECDYCALAPNVISYSGDITDILATTDKTTIENYWKTNSIMVGLLHSGNETAEDNLHDFYPGTPASVTPKSNKICELTFVDSPVSPNTGWWYNVRNNLDEDLDDEEVYTIHVVAKFKNGDSINEYRNVTIDGPASSVYNKVQIVIRGDIKDYSSSVVNYKIEIFKD